MFLLRYHPPEVDEAVALRASSTSRPQMLKPMESQHAPTHTSATSARCCSQLLFIQLAGAAGQIMQSSRLMALAGPPQACFLVPPAQPPPWPCPTPRLAWNRNAFVEAKRSDARPEASYGGADWYLGFVLHSLRLTSCCHACVANIP